MTTQELARLTLEGVGEDPDEPVYYTAGEVLNALSEAQRLFVFLTLCLETAATFSLTAATPFYHIGQTLRDWIVPLRVKVTGGDRCLPVRVEDLVALSDAWESTPGAPERYCCLGWDLFGVYKQPAGATTSLAVTYARFPVDLVIGGNPEIPDEDRDGLAEYAIPRLRMKEGGQEFGKVIPRMQNFLDVAKRRARYVRGRSLAARYDKLPVEVERFDVSRLVKMALQKPKPAGLAIPQSEVVNG